MIDSSFIKTIRIHKQQFDAIEKNASVIMLTCSEDGRCISFKRENNVYEENEKMENSRLQELFTDEHVKLIQKGITKAIKNVDFDSIVQNFIEGEFEYASDRCEVANNIDEMIVDVIKQHLVKSGLLK